MSYNSAQFWHHLSGDSVKSHRLRAQCYKNSHPTPLQTPITRTVVTCASDRLARDWSFHQFLLWDPLIYHSGSQNSEKHCTYQISSLLCNSGTASWKSCRGQGGGKDAELPYLLWACRCPQAFSTCSPTRKLSQAHPFSCFWRLHYLSVID